MIPRVHLSNSHSLSSLPRHYRPQQDISRVCQQQRPRTGLGVYPNMNYRSDKPRVPSMDADDHAFLPYVPNEVKHRKRTSSAQLKRLESIFKRDTKPNGVLRNELAAELDMTSRGVQVWFQNRRAKEKGKASKVAGKKSPSKNEPSRNASPSPEGDARSVSPQQVPFSRNLPKSEASSPARTSPPPQLHVITDGSSAASWQSSPLVTPDDVGYMGHLDNHSEAHLVRRGSLPALELGHSSFETASPSHMDPFARRLSVDASLLRLASNPYARLARDKNRVLYGPRPSLYSDRLDHLGRTSPRRPELSHSITMPNHGTYHPRHSSMDSRAFRYSPTGIPISPSPSPLSSYHSHSVRASLPDSNLYAFSSRIVSAPGPGPLPSPGFSFGVASTSSSLTSPCSDSERNSPDSSTYVVDTEDEGTSASYDPYSRFGSLASIASSTSTSYYSDVGSCDYDLSPGHSLVDSCGGGYSSDGTFIPGLDVNGLTGHHNPFSSPEEGILPHLPSENEATSTYPSPTTVSPAGSTAVNEGGSSGIPVSLTSELAYALQTKADHIGQDGRILYGHHSDPPVVDAANDSDRVPYFYGGHYGPSLDTTSLPVDTSYDSSSGNHTPASGDYGGSYPSSADIYPVDVTYSRDNVGSATSGEFAHPPDLYSYGNSSVPPAINATLPNNPEFSATYT